MISDVQWTSATVARPPADGVPWIVLIEPTDGTILYDEGLLGIGVVHTLGKPVCHGIDPSLNGTHCALPLAAATTGGPKLGISYFGIANPALDIVPTAPALQSYDVVAFGTVDLASGAFGQGSEGFVGTLLTTSSSNVDPLFGVYPLEALAAGMPSITPPGLTEVLMDDVSDAPGELGEAVVPSWSLSLGSRRSGNQVIYSVWRPVPNQPDGSDDQGGDSGDEVGTGETGGDGGGEPGCNCRADDTGGTSTAAFGLLVLAGLRRRTK